MHSLYSNFFPSLFKVNEETFYNSKQYIKVDKAASCNDDITRAKIMMEKYLRKVKMHGNNVKVFIPQKYGNIIEPGMLLVHKLQRNFSRMKNWRIG